MRAARRLPRPALPAMVILAFAAALLWLPSTDAISASDGQTGPVRVLPTWALIPKDGDNNPRFTDGQSFRLLFVTDATGRATSSNISFYDGVVRGTEGAQASGELGAIRNSIQAVISTSAVNARDHTGTAPANGSSYTAGEGVPIYWVSGDKVADDYADFWDGNWDSYTERTPAGETFDGYITIWTGSNEDGTKHSVRHAGTTGNVVEAGRLGPGAADDPINFSYFLKRSSAQNYYGLTQVITVDGTRPPTGFAAHPYSADSVVLVWNNPGDATIVKYQYRRKPRSSSQSGFTAWTDLPNTGAGSTFAVVSGLRDVEYTFQVRAFDAAAGPASDEAKATPKAVVTCAGDTATGQECEVAMDWALIPSGINPGDSFRLMFITSGTSQGGSRDIASYNTFVQGWAARSPFLHSFSSSFRALASAWYLNVGSNTAAGTARPNTRTRAGDLGASAPIYWVKGPKVADNYADLYDNSWDHNSQAGQWPTDQQGFQTTSDILVWSGTFGTGGPVPNFQLGNNAPGVGKPNTLGEELHDPGNDQPQANGYRMYAISPLLTVEAIPVIESVTITSSPGDDNTYAIDDEVYVQFNFSEMITLTGTPTLKIMVGSAEKTVDCARLSSTGEDAAKLECTYVVAEGDADADGISVASGKLAGTIKDSDNNNAILTYTSLGNQSGHKVDGVKPGIQFPTTSPQVGSVSTITLTDAGAGVKKYDRILVDGSSGAASDCATVSNPSELTPALAQFSYSYAPAAGSEGRKVCVYAEDGAGNTASALWSAAIAAAAATVTPPTTPSEPAALTSASSTGKRPIQVDPASIAGWSIEEGTKKKKVGRIGPTDASIPQARWKFTVNALATKFSSGMSVLTPASNYFTVAANGRVSYTGANPRVAGRTYTGMGTAFLTITISDSKEKASDIKVTIPIAMQAQPTLTAVASSITGWSVEDGTKSKKVGKIRIAEVGINRTEFALDRVTSEISGEFTGQITIDENTGVVSYDGEALVAAGDTAFYPHDIELDVTVKDKKKKFADGALEIIITVNEPFKPSITAVGAPYNGWEITVGVKSNDIGRVNALGDPPSLAKRLRYKLLPTGGMYLFGFFVNPKTGIVSYKPHKAKLPFPEVTFDGKPLTSFQLHIEVSHLDGYAETITVIANVKVKRPGDVPPT